MEIKPLGDRIVVKVLEAENKSKAHCSAWFSARKTAEAKWFALVKVKVLENGTVGCPEVKVGDKVIFGKYSGNEHTTKEGEDCLFCVRKIF